MYPLESNMQAASANVNIFRANQAYLDRLKKEGIPPTCHSCRQNFISGQLVHSKEFGGKKDSDQRHVLCAIKVGVLQMSVFDYRIWAAGLKEEKKLFERMVTSELRRVERDLQDQVRAEYPYFKVTVTVDLKRVRTK